MTRGLLDAGQAARRGIPVANAPNTDPEPLDRFLAACPPDVQSWADRALGLPLAARFARCGEVLLGVSVVLSDGPE
jgi:hypothetical protein